MYRRLPALALALALGAVLGATAACGRTAELTGPADAPLSVAGGALYDEVDDNGGMTGNGNVAADASGEETSTLDDGGMGGAGGIVVVDPVEEHASPLMNGGMVGNGNRSDPPNP